MRMAKIGLLLDEQAAVDKWAKQENVFAFYIREVLDHLGIPYQNLSKETASLEEIDLLITGLLNESQQALTQLLSFVEEGGTVIHLSDSPKLANWTGYKSVCGGAGYGYTPKELGHRKPVRFLKTNHWYNGEPAGWNAKSGFLVSGSPAGQILSELWTVIQAGNGKIVHCQADIPYSIVGIQQGVEPILHDGEPAPDGTAGIDDGLLKADDGFTLDWSIDRAATETGMKYFSEAHADKWREVLVHKLAELALEKGLTVPFVGRWPEGIEHIATISHDSDFNLEESADITLSLLKECGVYSTWCMIEPGYERPLYERIKQEGHELAFHYNALEAEGGLWSESEFKRQLQDLKSKADLKTVYTNKNHYTRFEGWGELFEWCEKEGIQVDQSRGPSKKGNIGFLFGTCLPYYPIAWHTENNRQYDILELGFLTQDLDHHALADTSVIDPFLEEVKRIGGVAHFLFHQLHFLEQPKVSEAFRKLVKAARANKFEFWTSKQISIWERARRKVKIEGVSASGEPNVSGAVSGANTVIWVPVPKKADLAAEAAEVRYGHLCLKKILSHKQAQTS
ncbi:hypothetical protein J9317_13740 [Metabacillus sp. KIGAM252]|uniref:NodB homology domain-containing protein n=1 Tax=Metabacillus flavus TaxID=2823519 RepID=A0ABS5LHH1_9BACI|nr:hypothetical protein [Metabacillus flavus]MBS2969829.1 hypothetical protein [Metabacillus flavus]